MLYYTQLYNTHTQCVTHTHISVYTYYIHTSPPINIHRHAHIEHTHAYIIAYKFDNILFYLFSLTILSILSIKVTTKWLW